jgi:hypothetical protein
LVDGGGTDVARITAHVAAAPRAGMFGRGARAGPLLSCGLFGFWLPTTHGAPRGGSLLPAAANGGGCGGTARTLRSTASLARGHSFSGRVHRFNYIGVNPSCLAAVHSGALPARARSPMLLLAII